MKHINDYILFKNLIVENNDAVKLWAYKHIDIPTSYQGFDNYKAAKDYLDWFFDNIYTTNKSDILTVYRVLELKDIKNLNINKIGTHFLRKDGLHRLDERGFYDSINISFSDDMCVYLLRVECNVNDIDWIDTIKNNLLYPEEYEMTLLNNSKAIIKSVKKIKPL